MFRSFAVFNYRVWFIGAVVSNIGAWMQATAQNWVVLTELTNNDAGAMGITMALQFAPPLLLVSVTGWVADRFDRRKLIMLTQSAMLLLAIALGVLILSGAMTLPMMYGFALALGVVTAFDNPARQAFVSDLVTRENASNAVALNAASFNTARLIGPAVAGIMIVIVGSGWVFLVNALTFTAMIGALALMRIRELIPRAKTSGRSRLADGFRYVGGRPDLLVIFSMVFLLGAFGMNFPIFASTMALEFGRGADGFGLLSSILAIGSLSGALLAARRDRARMRVVILGAGGFGLAMMASSLAPTYELYGVSLVLIGFAVVTMLTTANGYVQTTTDPALRGRVLALYMAILLGGTPVGAPIVGWMADAFGTRVAIFVAAVVALLACGIGVAWTLASGRLHRHESRRFRLTLDETLPLSVVAPAPAEFSDEVAGTTPIRLPGTDRAPGSDRPAPRDARPHPQHG
ncbi:MFS transporter [Microbacterium sp. RD1]|uniref:MFS transporter n=1 Tax=Microbacterium sp. RD1 TaxID=3457313 RepID=UPI003FA5BA31